MFNVITQSEETIDVDKTSNYWHAIIFWSKTKKGTTQTSKFKPKHVQGEMQSENSYYF